MEVAGIFIVVGIFPVLYTMECKPITFTFDLNTTLKINLENACINNNTGKLYVGARNKLYQLGGDLGIEVEVDLQPEIDKINCNIDNFCDFQNNQTDVYSKVILTDYVDNVLIHCITAHNGICLKRDLSNITKPVKQYYIPVVAHTDQASTFAFIAPGPVTGENEKILPVLYIGVEHPDKNRLQKDFPTFTSRSLYNFEPVTSLSSFYPSRYVYGFSTEGYSYMIRVQKQSGSYHSQILRVCQGDQYSASYSNIPLQCRLNGTLYNLAQSAYLGKSGSLLAKAMDISTADDILYVSFSKGEQTSNLPTEQSVLCIYPMRSVRRTFENNIQGCVDERDSIPVNCSKLKAMYDYCHNEERLLFRSGSIPIVGEAAAAFESLLTSLLVDVISNYTIAYTGNNKGHIVKVTIETQTSARVFEDVDFGEGYSIKPSMFFDAGLEYIYAMTDYKVMKIKLYDCCQFTNCQACSQAMKPYCGWCTLENRCSLHKDCKHRDELGWVQYNGSSCPHETEESEEALQNPLLTAIEPTVGPQAGGTHVMIFGKNLDFIYAPVTIGGICCHPKSASLSSRNTSSYEFHDLMHTKKYSQDSDALVCKTSVAYRSLLNKPLNVSMYGAIVEGDKNLTFTYVEDPKVLSIEPKASFQSGGRLLKVKGSNLFIIQNPRMYLLYNGVKSKSELCRRDKETDTLHCPTPRLNIASDSHKNVNSSFTIYHHIDLGFEMDNVANNLPITVRSIAYYTDPVVENFNTIVEVSDSKNNIVIKGKHFTFAATKFDVTVTIGCKMCTVVTLTTTTIICKPPDEKPVCDQNNDQQFSINVSIGYFQQHVGYVTYVTNTMNRKVNMLAISITVAVAVILLFTVTTIVYCKCRHKQKEVLNMIMYKNDSDVEKVELIQEEMISQTDED